MLFLNAEDIAKAAIASEIMNAIEEALLIQEKGDFNMPVRMHTGYGDKTLLLMPCFVPQYFATKLVSLVPENPEKGLPVLYGSVILNDGESGKPLAFLDGTKLTALRTAAVGSVGIRYLVPDNVNTLGLIGSGVQGFHQVLFACSERKFNQVYVHDLQQKKAEALLQNLSEKISDVKFYCTKTATELVEKAQVIITATNSPTPVIPEAGDLLDGKHFIGIGSYKPDMREFPFSLFKKLKQIFVDTDHAIKESGDLVIPLEKGLIKQEQILTLGKVISGDVLFSKEENETTLFKSVGMALFDLMTAKLIYEKSLAAGVGQVIEI